MIGEAELLEVCREGVAAARRLGADQVEVFASSVRSSEVELQKDDVHNAATEDETTFGVRVFRNRSLGFATVNGRAHLAEACAEALAMAAATPADEHNALDDPRPVEPLERAPDPGLAAIGIETLVDQAADLLARVRDTDARVRIDSGGVSAYVSTRAIATSTGIALSESGAGASANLFGMAVDGDDVGSFDYDSIAVLRADELAAQIDELAAAFVSKCVGALGARKGESFRGTVLLTPEVVRSFLLGDLLPVLSAKAVRTGRSPLADKLGQTVASPSLTLIDDGRLPEGTASSAFDREGTPTGRHALLDGGVLGTFLYDAYEARAAGRAPTGHARGGASSLPVIGPCNLRLEPGDTPFETLAREPERAILVSRFSGSSSPVTGEFSGVVKGGFLLRRGERVPIRETLIAGNLYDVLRSVSGVSKELRSLQGSAFLPALRVEDVSITAG